MSISPWKWHIHSLSEVIVTNVNSKLRCTMTGQTETKQCTTNFMVCNVTWSSSQLLPLSSVSLLNGLTEHLSSSVSWSSPSSVQFYELRLMFLTTALRPELSKQLHQATQPQILQSRFVEYFVVSSSQYSFLLPHSLLSPCRKEECPSSQQPWRASWRCSGRTSMSVFWTERHHPSLWKPLSAS